ncbi:MAG: metal-dependent transcriptional regulator, partial [Thermoleophilia bacterium]|nr:metal-dependent transcriptional regulator [Thermoleophilia bacterium]
MVRVDIDRATTDTRQTGDAQLQPEDRQLQSEAERGAAVSDTSDLTDRQQDYLKTIASLCLAQGAATVSEIAAARRVRVPTASEAVAQLTRRGLVEHENYGAVRLTPEGWRVANEILDRHQVLVHLFAEILGLPPELADKEACSLEHAVADQTLERVAEFVSRHAHRLPLQELARLRGETGAADASSSARVGAGGTAFRAGSASGGDRECVHGGDHGDGN